MNSGFNPSPSTQKIVIREDKSMHIKGVRKFLSGSVLCMAVILAGESPPASAAGPVFRAPAPVLQNSGMHQVHVVVKSIYVNDDADKGIYGCGDFQYIELKLDGVLVILAAQASIWVAGGSIFGSGAATEDYCSDTNYVLPTDIPDDPNRFITTGTPGEVLHLSGMARENDNFANRTIGHGAKTITVPAPGSYVDKVMEVEGSNGAGHLRLSITIRVRTI